MRPVMTSEGLKAAKPQTTPTWAFDLAVPNGRTLQVAMVDNAYGTDKELTDWVARQRVSYQEAAALTTPQPGRESWLVTHRPIFSLISDVNLPKDDPLAETWSSDGQMVASYGLPVTTDDPVKSQPLRPGGPDPRPAWQPRDGQRRGAAGSDEPQGLLHTRVWPTDEGRWHSARARIGAVPERDLAVDRHEIWVCLGDTHGPGR